MPATEQMRRAIPGAMIATGVALSLLFFFWPAHSQSSERIQRAEMDAMFASMRAEAPWNVDGPLLWGYFFLDPSRDKLDQASAELQRKGYILVDLVLADPGLFRLHVEKIETHTPASLEARNQVLYEIADRHRITYDGMDVGPAQQPTK